MTHIYTFTRALFIISLFLIADGMLKSAFACDYQPEPEPIQIRVVVG